MLRIDLTRADTEPLEFDERPAVQPAAGGEDVVSVGPVAIAGRVERAGKGYLLEGEVEGKARLRCVRCLAEFDFPFAERVDLHLLPLAAAPQDDETRLGRTDLEVRFYEEPQVDLAELAAEQFALAVPMKPLCAESCRGLCPRCGANLNQGACPCPPETDDRMAALKEWRPSE
ncbi:MAG TPA: DUF177 domain-containing protein [Thermoanaerobaculaceae bacterium]|nr:DUF177 domain-containing protein [Thermoanaerobaculaceae bacterium]